MVSICSGRKALSGVLLTALLTGSSLCSMVARAEGYGIFDLFLVGKIFYELGKDQQAKATAQKKKRTFTRTYSDVEQCEQDYQASKKELAGVVSHRWDEAQQYRLLGVLSGNLGVYSGSLISLMRKGSLDRKQVRQHIAQAMTRDIVEAIDDHRNEVAYPYLRFVLGSISGEYRIHNNPLIPGWRDESQQKRTQQNTSNLLAGCQAGYVSSASRYETAQFFNAVFGISEEAAFRVMDGVLSTQYPQQPTTGLVALVVNMAIEGTEEYFAAWAVNMTGDDARQYVASVLYQSVRTLYYILEYPETVNSNYSYRASVFGKESLVKGVFKADESRMQGLQPYPIPERFAGWVLGDKQEMGKLGQLGDYLNSRNCAYHLPSTTDITARTRLW